MKKMIVAILFIIMLFSVTGCGNNAELEALRKENEELKQQISNLQTTNHNMQNEKDISSTKELIVGKPFKIDTKHGSYIITLLSATKKDWRERSGNSLKYPTLMLSYEIENIDFSNEYYAGCRIDSSLFYVYDDSKTLLDTASSSYEGSFPDTVLPGYKGQFDLCYDLKNETNTVNVVLHRFDSNGKETVLGQTTINVEQ